MKKLFTLFICLLGIAELAAQGFSVMNYKVDIVIHKEGYFDVVENYDLNLDVPKHGIYRTIQPNMSYWIPRAAPSPEKYGSIRSMSPIANLMCLLILSKNCRIKWISG